MRTIFVTNQLKHYTFGIQLKFKLNSYHIFNIIGGLVFMTSGFKSMIHIKKKQDTNSIYLTI